MNKILELLAAGMLRKIVADKQMVPPQQREDSENIDWINEAERCHIAIEQRRKTSTHRSMKL